MSGSVSVLRAAPSVPNRLEIPLPIQKSLEAQGLIGKWVSGDPRYLTTYTGSGWSVVLFTEMSPEDQRAVRSYIDNPDRHYGEIRRGDAILVATTPQNIDFWNGVNNDRNTNQMGEVPSLVFEQTEEMMREAGAPAHLLRQNEELRQKQPPVAAHVTGGPNMSPDLLAEFRKQIEEYPST